MLSFIICYLLYKREKPFLTYQEENYIYLLRENFILISIILCSTIYLINKYNKIYKPNFIYFISFILLFINLLLLINYLRYYKLNNNLESFKNNEYLDNIRTSNYFNTSIDDLKKIEDEPYNYNLDQNNNFEFKNDNIYNKKDNNYNIKNISPYNKKNIDSSKEDTRIIQTNYDKTVLNTALYTDTMFEDEYLDNLSNKN